MVLIDPASPTGSPFSDRSMTDSDTELARVLTTGAVAAAAARVPVTFHRRDLRWVRFCLLPLPYF